MNSSALARIPKRLDDPSLANRLVDELSPSEMQTLFLYMLERKTKEVRPSEVLRRYEEDSYVFPSSGSQERQKGRFPTSSSSRSVSPAGTAALTALNVKP